MNEELCIIGEEKSESNIRLLEETKRVFSSVFFVPISGIHIGLKDKFAITYRTTDLLKFNAIFPRIPKHLCEYAYQLLSLFPENTYMPIKPIAYLLGEERFFLLTVLRKMGIETINLMLARSTESAYRIIEEADFPIIIRTPEKKTGVVVKNHTEAKSIIDALAALKQPIMVEDVIKSMVSLYVAEPEFLAAVKKKTEERDIVFASGNIKKQKVSVELEHFALEAARAVSANIIRVDIAMDKTPRVVNIDLNPNLIEPSRVTGINLPKEISNALANSYKNHMQKPVLMKFFEDARSVVKDVLKTKHMMI